MNVFKKIFEIDKRFLSIIILLLIGLALLFVPETVFAQAASDMPTLDGIKQAGEMAGDQSRIMMEKLLGPFAKNPLKSVGPASTMLGSLFFLFNACLFVVGTAYIGYNMIVAVAVSANDGEVLGKRMSGVWIPVRMGSGIFGMLPVFSGFSLAQAIMLMVTILGIGMANLLTTEAIDKASSFHGIIPPPGIEKGVPGTEIDPMIGEGLFAMHTCVNASKDSISWFKNMRGSPRVEDIPGGVKGFPGGWGGTCGSVSIGKFEGEDNTFWQRRNRYRSSAVKYEDINGSAKAIHGYRVAAIREINSDIEGLAEKWFQEYKNGNPQPYPTEEVNAFVKAASDKEAALAQAKLDSLYGDKKSSITEEAQTKMKAGGWMTVGSWYATFAAANSALQSAAVTYDTVIETMDTSSMNDMPRSLLDPLIAMGDSQTTVEDGTCYWPTERTPTGICSMGQNVVTGILGFIGDDTGGNGLVNPILASKRLGDYMLSFVGGAMTVGLGAKMLGGGIMKLNPVAKAAAMAKSIADKAKKLALPAKPSSDGKSIVGQMMSTILMALIVLGIIFGVYIPMVPFITWFTALVSYLSSVVEGLIAAQVWAFSHLNSEGEGMGQKTERGYVFMLNMLLRPALMVMGFFFASGIVVLMGTFLFEQMANVIANVQGDSMTGPMIIFGIICVFMIVLLMLVQTVFNLIYEVPDRVISWFGGGMEARMAKEMDGGIERQTQMAARWGGNMAMVGGMTASRR